MAFIARQSDLKIGRGTNENINILAFNGDTNEPGLRYNSATNAWQLSNDGADWENIGISGGLSRLNGLTVDIQTFVDDTNVTIVSSGTTHTLTWTGTLIETRGGTGIASYTAGDILYSDSANSLSTLSIGGANTVLLSNGTTPAWTALTFTHISGTLPFSRVSGTVPVAQGGTGLTSVASGHILVGNGTSALTSLDSGTSGQILSSNGTSPEWIYTISTNTSLGSSDSILPTQKAIKTYVDNITQNGISYRPPVRALFNDAGAALGTSVDGLTIVSGDRVLVVACQSGAVNGRIYSYDGSSYVVEQDGTGADDPQDGHTVWIEEGTLCEDQRWTFNGTTWVKTSVSNATSNFLGLSDTINSYHVGRILFESGSDVEDSTNLTFASNQLAVNGVVKVGTATANHITNSSGDILVSNMLEVQSNAYIDGTINSYTTTINATTETIDSFGDTIADAVRWDYVVGYGNNRRAGTIMTAINSSTNAVEFFETSTSDIGDTSDFSFLVDIDTNIVRLRGTASTNNYTTVRVTRHLI